MNPRAGEAKDNVSRPNRPAVDDVVFLNDDDAVRAGDENGPAVILGEEQAVVVEDEETGEAAEPVEDARGVRAAQERRHGCETLFVQIEIETGVSIGELSWLALLVHATNL